MKRILIVDDTAGYPEILRTQLQDRYGAEGMTVDIARYPLTGVKMVGPEYHLVLVDLEMPVLDGRRFIDAAVAKGMDKRRIIVLSARDADVLHERVPAGHCLAVINKTEPKQQEALLMMIDSIMRKPS